MASLCPCKFAGKATISPSAHTQATQSAAGSSYKWRWVSNGGRPPARTPGSVGPADLMFSGHQDGRVRAWDCSSEVPLLLATVPFDAGGTMGRLRSVSAMEVRPADLISSQGFPHT